MRITCGKCQSAFNLNLDGIHLQRFQFKCPSCAAPVMVDRADAPAPIKVAGAPAVLVPIGSSSGSATPPPSAPAASSAAAPQPIVTPPPPRRAAEPPPPPASADAAEPDDLPNAKFREAPTDRVGAVAPPKPVESPSVPAGPVRSAAGSGAPAPAALPLPPVPRAAAASVAAKPPVREPRPVVAAKLDVVAPSAAQPARAPAAPPAEVPVAKPAEKPAKPAGAEGIEAARAEILAQHAELMKKNWFELLGVKQDAPLEDIKSAYFKLAKQYHPDRFVATMSDGELAKVRELSSRVNQAFQDLRTEAGRQEYIKKLVDPEREKKRLEASAIIEAMIDHEKGRAALKQSNFELALQHFQRASALHPGEAEYHFMIAQSLQRARGVENSTNRAAIEAELRKAVDLQPNNAGYRIGIGHYWKARGEPDKAMGHYKEALKLDPRNHEAIREIRLFESRKEKARDERKRAASSGGRSGLGVRFGLR